MGGGQVGGLNILPKKRWHVRTKENIARVRRDEAKAAEAERQVQERAALAEQEARTQLLRQRASHKYVEAAGPSSGRAVGPSSAADQPQPERLEHVNFFADLEEQERTFGTNKEYEKEKKAEKEAEEMKVGLLHFLGEGSHESLKTVPWYERIERRVDTGAKAPAKPVDPHMPSTSSAGLTTHFEGRFTQRSASGTSAATEKRRHGDKHQKKEKRRKRRRSLSSSSSSSYEWVSDANSDQSGSDDKPSKPKKVKKTKEQLKAEEKAQMDKLRADRVRRETEEKRRAEDLLRKMRGGGKAEENHKVPAVPEVRQKYNSQFNPDICRQNRPK